MPVKVSNEFEHGPPQFHRDGDDPLFTSFARQCEQKIIEADLFGVNTERLADPTPVVEQQQNEKRQSSVVERCRFPLHQYPYLLSGEHRRDELWFLQRSKAGELSPSEVAVDRSDRCVRSGRFQSLFSHSHHHLFQFVRGWVLGREPFESVGVPANGCGADIEADTFFP